MTTSTDTQASTTPSPAEIDLATMRMKMMQIEIWLGLLDENLDSPHPNARKVVEYAEVIKAQLQGINRQHIEVSDEVLKQRLDAILLRLENGMRRADHLFNDPGAAPVAGQPPAPPSPPVDNSKGGGDDGRMNERITALEKFAEKSADRLGKIEQDVAVIRAGMATKDDLAKAVQDIALVRANYATKDDLNKVAQDVAAIRVSLPNFATKEDLRGVKEDVQKELNGATWKIISFVSTICAALVASTFFIAKNVGPAAAATAPAPTTAPHAPAPTPK
jgi:hypothetical protein